MRFPSASRCDPLVDAWFSRRTDELGVIARRWFDCMRACGGDVRELLHDGQPTACVSDAAFGYVDAFTAHVNVGFYAGAQLEDPAGLLQGEGRYMRHVTLRPESDVEEAALTALIRQCYALVRAALADSHGGQDA